jgi:endonuclease/exonuclease/phosphatase family metal-dependent hydrolase
MAPSRFSLLVFIRCIILFSMLGLLPQCQRSRSLGPPKAVPIRPDGAIELRLMTFNVRYENPGDRGSQQWKERLAGVVRVIRKAQPDCIGVQEALHGQAADLWASLPDYEFFGVGRDDGRRGGEYSGIFYRRDRFRPDPTDQGTFWLSDTPAVAGSKTWGNEIPRVAVWLRLIDLGTGRGFYVFNTHWDHRNQVSRERAALLMARRIDSRGCPEDPVALVGDFNSVESNPGLSYLTGNPAPLAGSSQPWQNALVDTYQVHHSKEKNRRTLHFWKANRDGNLKVDHILVSRGARVEAAEILSTDTPAVSDHFPVTARVIFPLVK